MFFYPKDNTPGCTTEAMQFRDKYKDFVKAGATVFGVSRDNMKSHDEFKAKLELPFELIADTEEKMCHMFGVVKNKIMYGKKVKGIERSTFLILSLIHIFEHQCLGDAVAADELDHDVDLGIGNDRPCVVHHGDVRADDGPRPRHIQICLLYTSRRKKRLEL